MTIKLCEYENAHWYKFEKEDGGIRYFPSITTKLGITRKPFLETWRGDIGNREADMRMFEASERGTRIHHAWYTLTTGGVVIYNSWKRPSYTKEEIAALDEQYAGRLVVVKYQDEMLDVWKLKQFMDIVKPEVIASELTVYSETNQEAGTIDNVFGIKAGAYAVNGRETLVLSDGIYIADLKTGHVFSDDAYLQTAAYANMYTEVTGRSIVGTLGLHTGAKTKKGIEGFATYARNLEEMAEDYKAFREVAAVWNRKNKMTAPRHLEFPSLLTLK